MKKSVDEILNEVSLFICKKPGGKIMLMQASIDGAIIDERALSAEDYIDISMKKLVEPEVYMFDNRDGGFWSLSDLTHDEGFDIKTYDELWMAYKIKGTFKRLKVDESAGCF